MKSLGEWWGKQPEVFRYFQVPLIAVALSSGFVAFLPITTLWFPVLSKDRAERINDQIGRLGTYGDMFGLLNAMFSGAAFCAIYYTLRIQQKQHDIEKRNLDMRTEVADLQIDEKESGETFLTTVPGGDESLGKNRPWYDANYVRLVLCNHAPMPAKGCRVILTRVEKRKPGEKFIAIPESKQSLRLLHITEDEDSPEHKTFTIPFNIPEYFNVCSIKKEGEKILCLIQVSHRDSKYKRLGKTFNINHDYRFHISVDSENSAPLGVIMEVSVGDKLDGLTVKVEPLKVKKPEPVYAK
jgi:5-hydroxyisourate hydrolase-like protein (transthyretin family)